MLKSILSVREPTERRGRSLRDMGLVVALCAACVFFAAFTGRFQPVHHWLFWRYALYWLAVLFWAAACTAFGNRVLARLCGPMLPKHERLTLALPLGVLGFGLAIFMLGLVHALHPVVFVLLPVAFFAAGWRLFWSDLRRLRRRLAVRASDGVPLWSLPLLALSVIGIALLYFSILSPETFSFDTRWYHMPMGQRYALEGKVGRFEEGFWQGAWPHLMSYLFAWCFLVPHVPIFDRVELGAHLDFVLFLATLAQIPVMVRRLVPRARVGLTWIALLAFPGVYLYDGNLHAGADHFAGFWALPIALSFSRAYRQLRPTLAALCATLLSAAALTKYSAITIIAPLAVALFLRGVWLAFVRRDRVAQRGLCTLIGVCLGLTSVHWLKNWIWYGDPMYPMLRAYFKIDPWVPDTVPQLKIFYGTARPADLNWRGALKALRATITYSFVPNDWEFFHHDVPTFGSLFTLSLPCLIFLRGARRTLWLNAATMVAIFCWYLTTHYDRYLHAIVPWMAACTAATAVLIFQRGRVARAALIALGALQVIWASDVPFIPTHNLINDSPLRFVAKFVVSGFEHVPQRLHIYEPLTTIGERVPEDATLLAHDVMMILGLDRKWVTDLHQCRISYGALKTPAAIDAMLKRLGVTHLLWPGQTVYRDSAAGDLAFMNYAMNYAEERTDLYGYRLARVPRQRVEDAKPDYDVAYFGCSQPYQMGWYKLSQLTVPVVDPGRVPKPAARLHSMDDAVARADFIVIDECRRATYKPPPDFVLGAMRGDTQLWTRVRASPQR